MHVVVEVVKISDVLQLTSLLCLTKIRIGDECSELCD